MTRDIRRTVARSRNEFPHHQRIGQCESSSVDAGEPNRSIHVHGKHDVSKDQDDRARESLTRRVQVLESKNQRTSSTVLLSWSENKTTGSVAFVIASSVISAYRVQHSLSSRAILIPTTHVNLFNAL